MFADDSPVPPTSCTNSPPSAEPPDESPRPNPATAPGERDARTDRRGDRIGDAEPPDESPRPNPATAPGERDARTDRHGDRIGDVEPPDESPPPNPATAPGERDARTDRHGDRIGDVEPPDESPPLEPATAPPDRGAQLARLGDRIAELSARIQAATHELLVLIREFDEREGWDGCLSCAQWLSWRAGLAPGAAREHVRVARALGQLPKLSDAMRRGRVSYSKVRAVTRVATPDNEQTLLDVALAGTAAHVERIARAWRRIDRNVEQAEERRRNANRELRTWVDEDGMVVVRGRLTPEVGAVLRRALEAACDQARRGPASDGGAEEAAAGAEEEAAGASAGAGKEAFAGSAGAEEEAAVASSDASARAEEPTLARRQADAIGTVAEAALVGGLDRGTAGDRYQVVLHVDAEALAEPRDVPAGTSGCASSGSAPAGVGGRVPAGTSEGASFGSAPRAAGGRVPAGTSEGASSGSAPAGVGGRVPAGTSEGASFGSAPRAVGGRVPAGTSEGASSGSAPAGVGGRVPAGTSEGASFGSVGRRAAGRRRSRSRGHVRGRVVRVGAGGRRRSRSRGHVRGRVVRVGAAGRRRSRSRGNVRVRGARVGAGGRRVRSRGNAGDDGPGGGRSRRWVADALGNAGPGTRPTAATVPDVRPVSARRSRTSVRNWSMRMFTSSMRMFTSSMRVLTSSMRVPMSSMRVFRPPSCADSSPATARTSPPIVPMIHFVSLLTSPVYQIHSTLTSAPAPGVNGESHMMPIA